MYTIHGTTSKAVPIAVNVKYYLDGEEKNLKEINGKAGEITIEIKFTNNLKNEVKINGKTRTLYTPFVVMCGTMISNDGNSEFEVTNGKVIDTGTKSIVVAVSSPGLYESLDLDEFKNLDTVKISYKTEKFNKNISLYIAATPKLIEDSDLEIFDKMETIASSINTLQKNMDTIETGANTLKDGAKALEDGVSDLANGANDLKSGASSLASGASDLKNGATSVADGISTISSKLQEIVAGVEQLKTGANELDGGIEQIISSIEEAQGMFTSKETEQSMAQLGVLKNQNLEVANTIKNTYETYHLEGLSIDQIILNPAFDNTTKANLITVKNNYESGLVTLLKGNNTGIDGLLAKINTISENLENLKSALEQAKGGSSKIAGGLEELKTGVAQLYSGSVTLSDGANSLKNGASTLSAGANSLSNGVSTLQKGTNDLKAGANTLTNGSMELASGISRFNKEGINELSSYAYKINDYSDIVKEIVDLSKNYNGFSSNNATVTNFVYVVK